MQHDLNYGLHEFQAQVAPEKQLFLRQTRSECLPSPFPDMFYVQRTPSTAVSQPTLSSQTNTTAEERTESFAPTHPAAQESDPADREPRGPAQKPALHRTWPCLWTLQVHKGKFRLDLRKKSLTQRLIRYLNGLPREGAKPPSLEVLRESLDSVPWSG